MKRDFRKKRDAVLPDFSTLYYRVKGFEKKACHCAAEFFNAMSSCKVFHDGIRPGAGDWFVTLEEN